jgi:hypothetical protein
MITDPAFIIEKQLHSVIDELHPSLKAISDEELIEDYEDHGVFSRDFLHINGKKIRMKWRVYYGSPETVRTVFEPAIQI